MHITYEGGIVKCMLQYVSQKALSKNIYKRLSLDKKIICSLMIQILK